MILMKTTKLEFEDGNDCLYSINLTMYDHNLSLDFEVQLNKLTTDTGHWYPGYKVKTYVIV